MRQWKASPESFNEPRSWHPRSGFWSADCPGLLAYKAINTADSMIGHMEDALARISAGPRARLDDMVNLVPARIAGLLLDARGGTAFASCGEMRPSTPPPTQAGRKPPLAGALDVRLGGPDVLRRCDARTPAFRRRCASPKATDLPRALTLYTGGAEPAARRSGRESLFGPLSSRCGPVT